MIKENIRELLNQLPENVELVGAAKTRTPEEVMEAVDAGLTIIGENYVQEAEKAFQAIGNKVKWHMIGHLQSNKARKAVKIFDMIETVDTLKLARAIDKACRNEENIMQVLIEINSGEELQKAGVMPGDAVALITDMSELENIRITGLMTMGPYGGDPERARPYFQKTKEIFDEIKALDPAGVEMKYLSMGMSGSFLVAIEEGANLVRIGTKLFGQRMA